MAQGEHHASVGLLDEPLAGRCVASRVLGVDASDLDWAQLGVFEGVPVDEALGVILVDPGELL